MPKIPAAQDQWYVIHVLSGQELKVRDNIERRRESEEMSDLIFEVLVPQERISEVKGGQKREANRKFYPGYIIVNMHLLNEDNTLVDRAWYFIQETDGIINYAGTKGNPMPMPKHEVESMLAQIKEREGSVKPAITHEVGDAVVVSDGPFQGQTGVIAEINEAKGELMVSVNIFGRETLVPLEYWQVELG
ncbi:MAG: transcription termination/antitermination protein NusG [Verrucomicrobiales bacterium]|jgi:transcription termination/antitermination protein NusG|nr:transcription termination/antitermination protein NusG [Verrucomicrobiales bacterium]MDP4638678.1 transcription termination/antitermination protein NusG [Verrucomicrobiales bacterium]MDP4792783.1 transcription termination/antitermination protein NusG [Verrucomicrobiales bacterium]MDP4848745.1 transcription termination/antitermination protein NusG [Verrucomicrobiales bacterium]MDP4939465.1 transcription termination/antitermination protein NusG [Verrucomicrobiales bacterium]